jgi:hypothetical protein
LLLLWHNEASLQQLISFKTPDMPPRKSRAAKTTTTKVLPVSTAKTPARNKKSAAEERQGENNSVDQRRGIVLADEGKQIIEINNNNHATHKLNSNDEIDFDSLVELTGQALLNNLDELKLANNNIIAPSDDEAEIDAKLNNPNNFNDSTNNTANSLYKTKSNNSTAAEDINLWQTLPKKDGTIRSLSGQVEKKEAKDQKKDTAGPKWFNLPAPILTPQLKQDLRLLNARGYLDPKHFMKRQTKEQRKSPFPKHFHIGTVVNNAADYYSGRLTHSERKDTFAESIMSDSTTNHYLKRKFQEIQHSKAQSEHSKKFRKQTRGSKKHNRKAR